MYRPPIIARTAVFWEWVSNTTASASTDPATQIQCYALPYGLLGFLAHFIMFYAVLAMSHGSRPLETLTCGRARRRGPGQGQGPLKHPGRDMIINTAGLIVSTALSVSTSYKCNGSLAYVLIAASKGLTTLASTAVAGQIAWESRSFPSHEEGSGRGAGTFVDRAEMTGTARRYYGALRWLGIEFVGSCLELAGLIMLMRENTDAVLTQNVPILTMSLAVVGFMGFFMGAGIAYLETRKMERARAMWEVEMVQYEFKMSECRPPRAQNRDQPRLAADGREAAHNSQTAWEIEGRCQSPRDAEAAADVRSPPDQDEKDRRPKRYGCGDAPDTVKHLVFVIGATFTVFTTLYSDGVLAAIAGSVSGWPTTGNSAITAVYVLLYFFVRIVPFMSS